MTQTASSVAGAPAESDYFRPSALFTALAEGQAGLATDQPDSFADLNLDQVVAALTAGREEYDLAGYFQTIPSRVDTARRQAVFVDCRNTDLVEGLETFAHRMATMRRWRRAASESLYKLHGKGCLLEAIDNYTSAVRGLHATLSQHQPRSEGLTSILAYLTDYLPSEEFTQLAATNEQLRGELGSVYYAVRIRGPKVTVTPERSTEDYSGVVLATFRRFQQTQVKSHRSKMTDSGFDHVQAQILACVARLNPELFDRLDQHCRDHHGFPDPNIVRCDRELQFYLAYLAMIRPLRTAGLELCLPELADHHGQFCVRAGFDLALALGSDPAQIICNDAQLQDDERILIVSGPNQGGKTTFARMIGQLHHLAALGCPVPARAAQLPQIDHLYTHFERQEDRDRTTTGGKLEDDLLRVRDILSAATAHSLLIINEIFSSTTLADAEYLGQQIIAQINALDAAAVIVTFVEELTHNPGTVSMVSLTRDDDPTVRTFRVERRPPLGTAHAVAMAKKHRLTREDIEDRLRPEPSRPQPTEGA